MRERKKFAERTRVLISNEVTKKYFLVCEGKETEQIYFDAVNNLRQEIGINPLIELIPIIRSYSEEGWSNPKKILDRMIKNLEENRTGFFTYETLCNWIIDYLIEERIIGGNSFKKSNVWKILNWICTEKIGVNANLDVDDLQETCSKILILLADELGIESLMDNVPEIIRHGNITYAEDIDKICFIVDRDKKSFVSEPENNQYAYVVNKCKEKKFGLYLTNPCFEFWLLLHFDEVFELDEEKLLNNPIINANRSYTENELRKIFKGYKKAKYDANILVRNIDKAIGNEKQFCEEIEKLENKVGSNIGLLITELRK